MMSSACYVYAILQRETPLPPGLTGFAGAPLTLLTYRDLTAVTSAIEGGPLRLTAEQVLQHESIVEAIRRAGPSLPVRFGTVLPHPWAVVRALEERYSTLAADLTRLGTAVELGLTILWSGADEAVMQPPHENPFPATRGPGGQYLRERLSERRRDEAQQERAADLFRQIDQVLSFHAREQQSTLLPTPRMLARAAYLLPPEAVPSFRQAFEELRHTHPDLHFLLSGPWPPYSFVTPHRGETER